MDSKTSDNFERLRGEGVGFDRIRRITGYLVGTLDRFNNGKRSEEHDRVKHSAVGETGGMDYEAFRYDKQ